MEILIKPSSRVQIIREAIELSYGQEGVPEKIKRLSDHAVRRYCKRNMIALAGPIQSVIEEYYDIANTKVIVPKRIQRLYMETDWVFAETEVIRAEREDALRDALLGGRNKEAK